MIPEMQMLIEIRNNNYWQKKKKTCNSIRYLRISRISPGYHHPYSCDESTFMCIHPI